MNIQEVKQELEKKFNKIVGTSATNLCTHCGWCIESCHVYLATKDPNVSPVAKAERIRKVYKNSHDWLSKLFPQWTGAQELTNEEFEKWVEVVFRDCTLCERCVINCPMAVETPQLLGAVRSVLTSAGKSPEILDQLANASIEREKGLEDIREYYLQQVQELEKEVQEKTGNNQAKIPTEQEADILYVPLSGAHTIVPQAIIFNKLGISWTLSMFESSNYGLFLGDAARAKQITERIYKEAQRLNVKEIVLSECGHAYTVMRWEAPKWFQNGYNFKIRGIVELLDEFVRDGKLKLNPTKNNDAITYHDPCNIGRKSGIFEEPRRVIQASTNDYREMTPNRLHNYCCGGGGGLVAELDWEESRLDYGKPKAEQIRQTGAKVVITSCDNCRHQITELSNRYDLNVSVSSVSELLINALEN
jgi:Fe-S oxidoreductase